MKAKLLLQLTFVFSFFGTAFSQQYHPFLNHSSWLINDWVSCCRPPELRTIEEGTDTTINAQTYLAFNDPFPAYDTDLNPINTVYLREDVEAKKVYKIVNGVDTLLYDFSLNNGDNISQFGYTFTATVDEVAVEGGTRKRITLLSAELYHEEILKQVWIEGVGSTAHPFYPDRNMYTAGSSGGGVQIRTRCSFQNGAHVFGNANCTPVPTALSTTTQAYSNREITLSPNPFKTELTINSAAALQNATFKLYNIQGKLVREASNLSGKKITISRENLNSGLYFAELFEQGKLVKTAKMMVD